MKRFAVKGARSRRFGIMHPHWLNNTVGYRGGIRK